MGKIVIHQEVSNCRECPFCYEDHHYLDGWDYEVTGYHCILTEEELSWYKEDGINAYCPYKKEEE